MNYIEFTAEEVKALLGCISSQLKIIDRLKLDEKVTEMPQIKKALQSAMKKIDTAARAPIPNAEKN